MSRSRSHVRSSVVRSALALAVAFALVTHAPDVAAAPPSAVAGAGAPILLVAGTLPWGVDADVLRTRLARELGVAVLATAPAQGGLAGTLFLETTASHEVTARFEGSDGTVTERKLALPREPERATDTIVLLSGNVARDEATELRAALARLRARKSTPSAAVVPPPSPAVDSPSVDSRSVDPPLSPAAASSSAAPPPSTSARSRPALSTPIGPATPLPCGAADGPRHLAFGGDLLPMLGTSLVARDAVRSFSFNLAGGLAGGLQGVEIGSAFNLVTGSVCGLQLAGAVNVGWRETRGAQLAGAINLTGALRGAQLAGALNLAGPVRGAQIAGALNLAVGLAGVQLAPVNLSIGDVSGAQLGVIDLARDVSGAQLGVIDLAASVQGAQIGVVNVAGRVQGAQIGIVNVADDSDFSLGVVSIVRRGRLHLDVWGAETGLLMAAVKHGGRSFHNFYGAGVRLAGGKPRLAFALGLGGHVPLTGRLFVDVDGLTHSLHHGEDLGTDVAILGQLRAVLGLRLSESIAVLAGPSYNVIVARNAADAEISALGSSLFHEEAGLVVRGWPGVSVGVQAF